MAPQAELQDNGLAQRIKRAAESILENETLTSDLEDEPARILMDWALNRARQAAYATAGLNEQAAQEALGSHLGAIRRLMRHVGKWVRSWQTGDLPAASERMTQIAEQLSIIYGDELSLPAQDLAAALACVEMGGSPATMILGLRSAVEGLSASAEADSEQGGSDGTEI